MFVTSESMMQHVLHFFQVQLIRFLSLEIWRRINLDKKMRVTFCKHNITSITTQQFEEPVISINKPEKECPHQSESSSH